MTDPDLLAPFDEDVLARVASQHDVSRADLATLLERHQEQARDNPGVEDLVYEWRSQFHEQPLVHRTSDAYYLRLRRHVWDEFADALDVSEADLLAVLAAHEEQVQAATGAEFDDDQWAMVLTRP